MGETAGRTLSSKAVACAWTVCYRNLPAGSFPSRLLAMANISDVSDTSSPPDRLCVTLALKVLQGFAMVFAGLSVRRSGPQTHFTGGWGAGGSQWTRLLPLSA